MRLRHLVQSNPALLFNIATAWRESRRWSPGATCRGWFPVSRQWLLTIKYLFTWVNKYVKSRHLHEPVPRATLVIASVMNFSARYITKETIMATVFLATVLLCPPWSLLIIYIVLCSALPIGVITNSIIEFTKLMIWTLTYHNIYVLSHNVMGAKSRVLSRFLKNHWF